MFLTNLTVTLHWFHPKKPHRLESFNKVLCFQTTESTRLMVAMTYSWVYLRKVNLSMRSEDLRMYWNLEKTFRSIRVQCVLRLFSYTKSYFRLFGELYIDDLDTGEQDFNGTSYGKICQSNIIVTNYADLKEDDRCPNLDEKSANHFSYRVALYFAIFTTNVILVNILIGTISNTLSTIKGDEYYLYSLEVKVRLYKNVDIWKWQGLARLFVTTWTRSDWFL